jgi:hypothetical protein
MKTLGKNDRLQRVNPWNILVISWMGFMCVLMLSACEVYRGQATPSAIPQATETPFAGLIPINPQLGLATIQEVFNQSGDHLQIDGEAEQVNFTCTVFEGTFCGFDDQIFDAPIEPDLSRTIIDQINSTTIENANQNTIRLRCRRPVDSELLAFCDMDRGFGDGWQVLSVE